MGEERDMGGPHGPYDTARAGYRERASRLSGAVLWTNITSSTDVASSTDVMSSTGSTKITQPAARPVLPDGCTDLIWSEGRLLVAGPDTGPYFLKGVPAGTCFVGLRFAPGQGPSVFGVPARELRNLRVPLEDLWPADRVREAAGRIAAAGAPGRVLEELAAARLREAGPSDGSGRTAAITAALARGESVAEVADSVGLSERQLHRHSLDAFGYGPKMLTRVLRFVRALDLARSGVPYAEVAARAGYADQAHLAREVKSLAGAPMGVLLGPG